MITNSWLFQVSPRWFEIDEYFATEQDDIRWLVRQHKSQIQAGDEIFIWRAIGEGPRERSGVVSHGKVLTHPAIMADTPEAMRRWRNQSEAGPQLRVKVQLVSMPRASRVLQRDQLQNDPVLEAMVIYRMRNQTNLPLIAAQADRLRVKWTTLTDRKINGDEKF